MRMIAYFAMLLIVAGSCGVINLLKKRRVVNSFKVASWTVAALLLTNLALLVLLVLQGVTEPGSHAEDFGGVLGSGVIPLVLGTWLANNSTRRERQRTPSKAPPAA